MSVLLQVDKEISGVGEHLADQQAHHARRGAQYDKERGSKRKMRRKTTADDAFRSKLAKVTEDEHDLPSAAVQNMTEEMDTVIMDIGGTGSRAALFSSSAELLIKVEGPGANPYRVGKAETARTITNLLHQLGLKSIDRLVIGMAGITCPDSLESVRNGISASGVSIDKHYAWLMSDAELTHIAAFGFVDLMQLQGSCSSGAPEALPWLDQLEILMLLFAREALDSSSEMRAQGIG